MKRRKKVMRLWERMEMLRSKTRYESAVHAEAAEWMLDELATIIESISPTKGKKT